MVGIRQEMYLGGHNPVLQHIQLDLDGESVVEPETHGTAHILELIDITVQISEHG